MARRKSACSIFETKKVSNQGTPPPPTEQGYSKQTEQTRVVFQPAYGQIMPLHLAVVIFWLFMIHDNTQNLTRFVLKVPMPIAANDLSQRNISRIQNCVYSVLFFWEKYNLKIFCHTSDKNGRYKKLLFYPQVLLEVTLTFTRKYQLKRSTTRVVNLTLVKI